jgi:hypothetical protein
MMEVLAESFLDLGQNALLQILEFEALVHPKSHEMRSLTAAGAGRRFSGSGRKQRQRHETGAVVKCRWP